MLFLLLIVQATFMKRIVTACVLLLTLCLPVALVYFGMQYRKACIRREMKQRMIAGIDRSELVFMKFTTGQMKNLLRWVHDGEFEYAGEMYDIIYREDTAGYSRFWCWHDREETRLNRERAHLVNRAMGHDPITREQGKRFQTFLVSLFWEESRLLRWVPEATIQKGFLYIPGRGIGDFPPPVPPPRFS